MNGGLMKRGNKPLEETRKDLVPGEIAKMYESGMSINQICYIKKCSWSPIRRMLNLMGVDIKKPGGPSQLNIPKDDLSDLFFNQGKSLRAIAKEMQCSTETIRRHLQKHGWSQESRKSLGKELVTQNTFT